MTINVADLVSVSKITDNIYVSGFYPLENTANILKQCNIKYILSCVSRDGVVDVHNKLMMEDPSLTILYIPYNDNIDQNLWKINKNNVDIVKYSSQAHEFNKLKQLLNLYQNKSMIEIAYHFIDMVVSSGNNILVHCMAGISRSVSVVAYYLMKKYNIPYDQAYNYIKNIRSIAYPNDSFRTQLTDYQTARQYFNEETAQNSVIKTKQNKFLV